MKWIVDFQHQTDLKPPREFGVDLDWRALTQRTTFTAPAFSILAEAKPREDQSLFVRRGAAAIPSLALGISAERSVCMR